MALRLLRHRPGFCAAVVLTLAIALGATTAIFSLLNALILRPLPFPDPERLVEVTAVVGGDQGRLTLFEYRDLARDTRTFQGWAAFYRSQYNVTGSGPPEALSCTIASSTLFSVLGARPLYGDVWSEKQDFTREFLVMLSHRVWQQRFGGRPEVVGSTITMDGAPYRVTGVLPEGFDFPVRTDVFRSVTDYNAPHVRRYSAVARIRAGVTLADAQAELDAFSARFAQMYPQADTGVRLRATPLRDAYVGRARPFVWILAVAVSLLLVIAAVNVTDLLVSRAIAARAESAVRLALGAERRHLIRQSIAEALVLTAIAAG
jgi:putative ABC transport system permease protein